MRENISTVVCFLKPYHIFVYQKGFFPDLHLLFQSSYMFFYSGKRRNNNLKNSVVVQGVALYGILRNCGNQYVDSLSCFSLILTVNLTD